MTIYKPMIVTLAVLMTTACATEDSQSQYQTPAAETASSQDERRGPQSGERPGKPDLSQAAAKLGVSEDALDQALRNAGGPPPDFDKAAASLGISAEDLKAALPPPPRRRR